MAYQVLTQADQDAAIVAFYGAQEQDLFLYTLNAARYTTMLVGLPAGAFQARIQGLLNDTNDRIVEVTAILAATLAQLPAANVVQAYVAAKVAEAVATSSSPPDRANAISASDPTLVASIASVAALTTATTTAIPAKMATTTG